MGWRIIMATIEWKPAYSVGVEQLDEQHQKLLQLINNLSHENPEADAKQCFVVLNELVQYVQLHFNTEENLMREHGYADLKAHQQEHEIFTEKLFDLNRKMTSSDGNIFSELTHYLKDWYIAHVLGTDQGYKDFFKEKSVT